jgi:hypothetical protein
MLVLLLQLLLLRARDVLAVRRQCQLQEGNR